jgi:hypothetical protein
VTITVPAARKDTRTITMRILAGHVICLKTFIADVNIVLFVTIFLLTIPAYKRCPFGSLSVNLVP